eukprot:CAMPEP_0181320228 /NCGR_PEP_ID=MMETSP1101-20121128/18005_1 /TAXON_ID=46948 /ORGANISM="Rhodomonas abbreviata, Strain Caron Lab Isolate" /LENGTH=64 /DNA_ID=CAMNT_0023427905 /DNA_START=159 /DNA_END=353 /DNA_ORIENTATION=-
MFQLLRQIQSLAETHSYVEDYGQGDFDGQGSGHDYGGDGWHPSFGYVNNCDGSRSHTYCDYMTQ